MTSSPTRFGEQCNRTTHIVFYIHRQAHSIRIDLPQYPISIHAVALLFNHSTTVHLGIVSQSKRAYLVAPLYFPKKKQGSPACPLGCPGHDLDEEF